jgi:hypothetical protein
MELDKPSSLLLAKVEQAKTQYQHLLLLVGAAGKLRNNLLTTVLANQPNAHLLEVSSILSQNLLEIAPTKRASEAARLLNLQIRAWQGQVLYLTNIELLFEPSLQIRPLELFKNLSRTQTLVIVLDAKLEGDYLIYAEQGHPEYQVYSAKDFLMLSLRESLDEI